MVDNPLAPSPTPPTPPAPPAGLQTPPDSKPNPNQAQIASFFKLGSSDQRAALQALGAGDPSHISRFFQMSPGDQKAALGVLIEHHAQTRLTHAPAPAEQQPRSPQEIENAMGAFASKQSPHATRRDMETVGLKTLPFALGAAGAMAGGAIPEAALGLEAGLGTDLLGTATSILGAGAGGAVGAAGQAAGESMLGVPGAPQGWNEAAQQIYQGAVSQMKQEAEGQALGLGVRGIVAGGLGATEGAKFLRSPEGRKLIALNQEMGTGLTVSELVDSPMGKKLMEGGSVGILGNLRAQLAQRSGIKAGVQSARAILNSIGNDTSLFKIGKDLAGNSVDLNEAVGIVQNGQKAFMKLAGEQHAQVLSELGQLPAVTLNKDWGLASWLRSAEQSAAKDVGSAPGREGIAARARLKVAREVEAMIPEPVLKSWLADRPMQWSISMPELDQIRSSMGMFQPGAAEMFPGLADAEAKKGYKAVLETMGQGEQQLPKEVKKLAAKGLKPADVQRILDGWREYRAFTAQGMRVYESGIAAKLAGADPLQAVQAILKGNPQEMQVVNRAMEDYAATGPQAARTVRNTRRSMQRAYLQFIVGSDVRDPGVGKEWVDLEKRLAGSEGKLKEASPEFVNGLFNTPKAKASLRRFRDLSNLLSRRKYPSEYSGRFALIEAALGAGGLMIGEPRLASGIAATELVTGALSQVAYSPRISKLVTDTLTGRVPASKTLPTLVRLLTFAKQEWDADGEGGLHRVPPGELDQIESGASQPPSMSGAGPATSQYPPQPPPAFAPAIH